MPVALEAELQHFGTAELAGVRISAAVARALTLTLAICFTSLIRDGGRADCIPRM